jgi:ribosomal protein L17
MQHTAHHAIKNRLNMWRMFFSAGIDTTPQSADDLEYGLDDLIDLARSGDSAELHQLAALVEQMGQDHMLKLDDDEAEQRENYALVTMLDDVADLDAFANAITNAVTCTLTNARGV